MNITTINCDIFIEQGADWTFDFPVDPSINLSLAVAAMMIRTPTGATFIANLTTANNGLVVNSGNQTITANITNVQSALFVPGDYVYDLKVQVGNIIYRTNEGNVIVDQQVTYITPPASSGLDITTEDGQKITTEDGQKITTS